MNSLIKRLGFGCWQIGGNRQLNGVNNGWHPIEKNQRVALVERAIELGFTFFDTASSYGDGESEEILGLGVYNSRRRDKVQICTKINLTKGAEEWPGNWRSIEKNIQKSLERLKVDKIDVLLLHNPPLDFICEKNKGFFEEAKARLYIDRYGVSARSLFDLEASIKLGFGQIFQWNFSILERRALKILEAYSSNKSFTFVGRSILYRGLLTDNFVNMGVDKRFNDARSKLNFDVVEWVYKNAVTLRPLAFDLGLTLSQLAVSYALMNPVVPISLIGVRTFDNLDSLEHLLSIERAKLQACYEVASDFVPLPFD